MALSAINSSNFLSIARLCLAILILLAVNVYAQDTGQRYRKAGTVLSSEGPVPYVNVFPDSGAWGTVTNIEGDFVITIPAKFFQPETVLNFTSIGYDTKRIMIKDLADSVSIVNLVPSNQQLPEVVIEGKNDSASIVLQRAIENIPKNYPKKRHMIEAFYRELSIKDSIYSRLTEAAILVEEPGYRGNKVSSDDLSVERNKVRILEIRTSVDNRDSNLVGWAFTKLLGEKNDIYEILNDNYVRFIDKKNDHFLSRGFLPEYDVTIAGVTTFDGAPVSIINLSSKNKRIFFIRDVNIYISGNDYAILRIENDLIVNPERKEILKFAIDSTYFYQSIISYKKMEGQYVPCYIRTRKYASNINPLSNNSLQHMEVEFLLTNYFEKDFEKIRSRYVSKRDEEILKDDRPYNEEFWKNYSTVVINPISNKAKKNLEKNKTLDEQFKSRKN
ncbi:MAG TPA: carboxypeptidase-like regulatory domain-containing protein [Chryseosolibacter sp.]